MSPLVRAGVGTLACTIAGVPFDDVCAPGVAAGALVVFDGVSGILGWLESAKSKLLVSGVMAKPEFETKDDDNLIDPVVALTRKLHARVVGLAHNVLQVVGGETTKAVLDAAPEAARRTIALEWTTQHDQKVRESHRAADGERRRPGVPFIVGGWPMDYPGDQRVPPALWIGCRCFLRRRKVLTSTVPSLDESLAVANTEAV